jgi:hypothetical protein
MRYEALPWNNPAVLSWNVYDSHGAPLAGATVTVTMYVDRSIDRPDLTPGTPVPSITHLLMVDQGDGNYQIDIPASVIPAIGDNYVLVFDAVMSGATIGHWEATTSVVVDAPQIPDLAELDKVKDYLGIDPTDTSEDATLDRMIRSCSADFLNRIKRPGLLPPFDYTDNILMTNWKTEDREKDVFLKNWPVNRVTSVTINEEVLAPYDPTNPTQMGWFFDPTLPAEERQYITLLGYFWPVLQSWYTPYRSIYRPRPLRIQVAYNGGYNYVPYDIEEAITEWVAFKKGLRELQSHDQTDQLIHLGDYQQNNMIARSTIAMSNVDMPNSVVSVIKVYERPIVP